MTRPLEPQANPNAYCQIGDLRFRVNPTNVSWTYSVDTARIETLGGQVVQILGATLSDMTISGDFGQDHRSQKESWQLATAFHKKIQQMMDAQTSFPGSQKQFGQFGGTAITSEQGVKVHNPYALTYRDGLHDWNFQVLIKDISDPMGGSLTYSVARPNFQYQLTLFIVQADTTVVKTIASDAFISRIAQGIGWDKSSYHGAATADQVQQFISANGGSITGVLAAALGGTLQTDLPASLGGGTDIGITGRGTAGQ